MKRFVFLLFLIFMTCGCEQPAAQPHEDLDAALWVHSSAEYRAIARSVYRMAREKLAVALEDKTWSALPAQQDLLQNGPDEKALPPAVILDVDETVLDNLEFQARLIDSGAEYNLDDWHAWVDEATADLIPGAAEFIAFCRERGVTVFFVTNRRAIAERGTRRNLELKKVLSPNAEDTILSKYERDEWTTDKSSRREFVASRYRLLLVIGDDLNDFVWVDDKPSAEARRQMADEYADWWGHKWFMIPNPNYGGWERALYDFDDTLPRVEKIERKLKALETEVTPGVTK